VVTELTVAEALGKIGEMRKAAAILVTTGVSKLVEWYRRGRDGKVQV
jgi:hypothetical protein